MRPFCIFYSVLSRIIWSWNDVRYILMFELIKRHLRVVIDLNEHTILENNFCLLWVYIVIKYVPSLI